MALVQQPDKWASAVKAAGQKILVIVMPISGNSVHKKFFASAINVMSPGVVNKLAESNIQTTVHINPNFPIDYSRNNSIDICLNTYLADYIFFMDTDQTFPGNTILNLMETLESNPDVSGVTGMYFKKRDPFEAVIGRYAGWDEMSLPCKDNLEKLGYVTKDGEQCLYWKSVHYFDKESPFWVDAFGMGCLLMRTDALKQLERPYFKYTPDPKTNDGALLKNSEDMWFCAQLKKKDLTIVCDPRVQCGHIFELESNVDLYEETRDTSFGSLEPEKYKEIMAKTIDVRAEQEEYRNAQHK